MKLPWKSQFIYCELNIAKNCPLNVIVSVVISSSRFMTSPLKDKPWPRNEWNFFTIRCGVIGIKLGSYPMYLKDGKRTTCTLYQVKNNLLKSFVKVFD